MIVDDSKLNGVVSFEDLLIGDCFIYNDEYFIKIDDTCAAPNAFNLKCNEVDVFTNGNTIVTSVNAKVVIE